jgi:hypothetical protein
VALGEAAAVQDHAESASSTLSTLRDENWCTRVRQRQRARLISLTAS